MAKAETPSKSAVLPKNPTNKKKRPEKKYGLSDPAFRWQLGGLVAGVLVAFWSSTQHGKQTLRSAGLEDVVLRFTKGTKISDGETATEVAKVEPQQEVKPSVCLTQTCAVKVFPNGEHEGGRSFRVAPFDMDGMEDIGQFLGPKMGCVSTGMRSDEPQHCKVFNGVGQRVLSMGSVEDGDTLYIVPQERNFVWPTIDIGHKVTVPHVKTPLGAEVMLETLSHSPRVFSLTNFMDTAEADNIITDALKMTQEEYRLKRSSTGTKGKSISKTRTSDNAFVTSTKTAMALKKRIFQLLGIEEYVESWADGLQVLRYNESQAYVAHYDYLEPAEGHDFNSAGLGTNRFATVVLYFNDVKEGGETVFTKAPGIDHHDLPADSRVPVREVLSELGLPRSGWEERLLLQCRRNMAVPPKRGQAVLFYNQHPDGRKDMAVEHGACPVISGQKWAANLWVWNGPRYGLSSVDPETGRTVGLGHGKAKEAQSDNNFKITADFINVDVEGASLLFWDQPWAGGEWNIGQKHTINTFLTHRWVVKVHDTVVQEWLISEKQAKQTFVLSKEMLNK